MIQKKLWSMCYSVYMEFFNTQVYSIRWKFHDVMHFIFYMATGFPDRRLNIAKFRSALEFLLYQSIEIPGTAVSARRRFNLKAFPVLKLLF